VALACLKLIQPEVKLAGDVGEIMKLSEAMRKGVPPARFDVLVEKSRELREAGSEEAVERWMTAVDLSLSRAGLLLCDDVETAFRLQAVEVKPGLKATERVRELLLYAVSDSYFKLREQMGLQVKP